MSVSIQIQKIHSITKDSSLEKEIQNLLDTSNPIDNIRESLLSESLNNDWARNHDPLIKYLVNSDYSSENEPYNYELNNESVQNLIVNFKEKLNFSCKELVQHHNNIILVSVN